jgi:transposase
MPKRLRVLRSKKRITGSLIEVNPNAAGIDAGSAEHWVAVPEGGPGESVRKFGTFTEDLYALADWLAECGIETVAIEATGVYWIPLFEILEARGFAVNLVDSRSIGKRNKKTDVVDCQWIRQLHMYGLLDAAFRPKAQMMPLRSYMRQRQMLIDYGSDHIRHMQKALDLMNLKLHMVLSDITGVTGQAIIRAILDGERDPKVLASMRDPKCKNSAPSIAKALTGNYRDEHVFALRQAVELFDVYQSKLTDCDARIADTLNAFETKTDLPQSPKTKKRRRKNQPRFDAGRLLHEKIGVDLLAVDGLAASTVLTIVSETGVDMQAWPTDAHFASWLALSPNNRISGGRMLSNKRNPPRANRATQAFRLAAQTLERAQCALGAFFRRVQSRSGRDVAIKATAHKLARIFYSMVKNKTPYLDPGTIYYEQRYRDRLLNSLKKKAQLLGFQLTPMELVH